MIPEASPVLRKVVIYALVPKDPILFLSPCSNNIVDIVDIVVEILVANASPAWAMYLTGIILSNILNPTDIAPLIIGVLEGVIYSSK